MKVIYIGNANYTGSLIVKTKMSNSYTLTVENWTVIDTPDLKKIFGEKIESYWINFYWEDIPKAKMDKTPEAISIPVDAANVSIWDDIPESADINPAEVSSPILEPEVAVVPVTIGVKPANKPKIATKKLEPVINF